MQSPEEQIAALEVEYREHPERYPGREGVQYYVVLCDARGEPVYGPISRRFHVHSQRLRILTLADEETRGLLVFPLHKSKEENHGN